MFEVQSQFALCIDRATGKQIVKQAVGWISLADHTQLCMTAKFRITVGCARECGTSNQQ
jgi:hypothetical protein